MLLIKYYRMLSNPLPTIIKIYKLNDIGFYSIHNSKYDTIW